MLRKHFTAALLLPTQQQGACRRPTAVHCTLLVSRRFASFRVLLPAGAAATAGCGLPLFTVSRRHYGPYGASPPPPPSPYGYGAPGPTGYGPPPGGPMMPQQGFYGAAPAYGPTGGTAGPMGGGEIGTRERPLVVAPAAQPRSLANKLWAFLIFVIAASAAMHLLDEIDLRSGGDGGAAGKSGSIGQSRALAGMFGGMEHKPVELDSQVTSFADIQGCDEAKQELLEIVMFLKDPKRFLELGGRLPKGVLLVGPPGCGKTMLAKAIAKESGVKFFYATGSEFDEMFVGVGSRRVRELFAAAKSHAPALVFIDEIDALGGKRTGKDHAHSRMTLNQLLAEMDGFLSSDEVIVIAATNTPDTLDKALTRAGRFDTQISVDPPDLKGRAAICETYLAKVKSDGKVTALDVAKGTPGMTGAELSNLINIAAIRAAVRGKPHVTIDEIEYAKDRVLMGAENRSKAIPEDERRVTAYHEGGHALVAILLEKEGADPVHKATIVPRGSGVLGLVQQQPDHDRYSMSKKQIHSRLKVCLAGRVAEELLLGPDDMTTGASSDFQQATGLARNMVRRFGFSQELGTVDYESAETSEGAFTSDNTKEKIELEVRSIVGEAYKETKALLTKNWEALDSIAKQLLVHDTLSGVQLKKVIAGEKIPVEVKEASAFVGTDSAATKSKSTSVGGGGGGGSSPPPKGGATVPVGVRVEVTGGAKKEPLGQ